MEETINNPESVSSQDMSRQEFDQSLYTLDAKQASALFAAAGVPRSPRTMERYCEDGHLVCMKIETERNEKYLITRESVNARIIQLQQVVPSGHVETQRVMSSHVETQQDMSRHDTTRDEMTDEEKRKIAERIKELEREIFDLKIANRGKDYFLGEVEKDKVKEDANRKEMIQQLIDQSFRIGELEGILCHARIEVPQRAALKPVEPQRNFIDVTPEHTKQEETAEDIDYAL